MLDGITWFTSHDNRIKVYAVPAKIWKGKNPSSAEGKFLINGNRLNNNMRKTNWSGSLSLARFSRQSWYSFVHYLDMPSSVRFIKCSYRECPLLPLNILRSYRFPSCIIFPHSCYFRLIDVMGILRNRLVEDWLHFLVLSNRIFRALDVNSKVIKG